MLIDLCMEYIFFFFFLDFRFKKKFQHIFKFSIQFCSGTHGLFKHAST